MERLDKAKATMLLLCTASDEWDLDETLSLHQLPLVVVDPKGSVELHTVEQVRAMYQGLRARFAEMEGVRMETDWQVFAPTAPGSFLAETNTTVFGAKAEVLTRFSVSFVLSDSTDASGGALGDVKITTMIIDGERQAQSPLLDCPCIPSPPTPLAA